MSRLLVGKKPADMAIEGRQSLQLNLFAVHTPSRRLSLPLVPACHLAGAWYGGSLITRIDIAGGDDIV
jgi:hypothetical protein